MIRIIYDMMNFGTVINKIFYIKEYCYESFTTSKSKI